MAKRWIQAMGMKKGALTAMAKAAGKSISAYCASPDLSTLAKRRCALAKTLKGLSK